jgi:retron-type reverse transcriptase
MKIYKNIFEDMISLENLLTSWYNFRQGKTKKPDVQEFGVHLEKHLFDLHRDLVSGRYKHGRYYGFYIQDPKLRHIHKAEVRDRIVHQSIYTALTKIYEPTFVHDSYSCRRDKGTHKAVKALESMTRKVSKNYTTPCYALKCDIRKFFDSIDHEILLNIIARRIKDKKALALFKEVIESFFGYKEYGKDGVGIPIGNITSQIFANIYLNELDQFAKQTLKEKYYMRYADDFIFLSPDKDHLKKLIPQLKVFLSENLKMKMHPKKVILCNFYQGVDFLGYVLFPRHKVLRTKTKQRMLRKMNHSFTSFMKEDTNFEKMNQVFQSYFGIMRHGNCHKLDENVRNKFWVYMNSKDRP